MEEHGDLFKLFKNSLIHYSKNSFSKSVLQEIENIIYLEQPPEVFYKKLCFKKLAKFTEKQWELLPAAYFLKKAIPTLV